MELNAVKIQLSQHAQRARVVVTRYWQPTLVIVGALVAYIGIITTTYALTHHLGWGPAATVAGIAAATIGLFASKIRVEDRK